MPELDPLAIMLHMHICHAPTGIDLLHICQLLVYE
jgi:hypothetical protein